MHAGAVTAAFPDDFMWGTATASYQVEGSPLADGAGPSIWHRFSHTPGTIARGENADISCDHYRHHASDVALMKELGLRAYRFSIAWPRVMPAGRGAVNAAGLDFYDRLVDELLDAGIAPFVTLYHWDLPGALQDLGGWCNRDIAGWFGDYADSVYARLGDRVRHWITLNEPSVVSHLGHVEGIHAPGMRDLWAGLSAAHNLLRAHGEAVTRFRATGGPGEIGITLSLGPQRPATDKPEDVAAAARSHAYSNGLFLDPVFKGSYPEVLEKHVAYAWPAVEAGDMEAISVPIDFLGVNYYAGAEVFDKPGSGHLDVGRVAPRPPLTAFGWPIQPQGLGETLRLVHETYGAPRIYITENGAAFEDVVQADGTIDDTEREDYLRQHFLVARAAMADGVDLRGYFVWSFMDNFEWAMGYDMRFGIVRVDYSREDLRRTVKRSGRWYAGVIANNGL